MGVSRRTHRTCNIPLCWRILGMGVLGFFPAESRMLHHVAKLLPGTRLLRALWERILPPRTFGLTLSKEANIEKKVFSAKNKAQINAPDTVSCIRFNCRAQDAMGSWDKPESTKVTGKWCKSLETVKSPLESTSKFKNQTPLFSFINKVQAIN